MKWPVDVRALAVGAVMGALGALTGIPMVAPAGGPGVEVQGRCVSSSSTPVPLLP